MAIEIPLKLKYREHKAAGFKAKVRTGSSGGSKTRLKEGHGPRRRTYGPFYALVANSQKVIGD